MKRRDKQRIDLFLVITAWNNYRRRQVLLSKIYTRHDLAYWQAKVHVGNATVNVTNAPVRWLSQDDRHVLKDNFKRFRPWIPTKRNFDDHLSKLVAQGAQEFDFDRYDWAAIKIGEKSINPLYSREVAEVLEEAGM